MAVGEQGEDKGILSRWDAEDARPLTLGLLQRKIHSLYTGCGGKAMGGVLIPVDYEKIILRAEAAAWKLPAMGIPLLAPVRPLEITGK
ncbi:MAG: hypothetical protein LBB80_04580 [Treponema sp.]|nr:hypothetical protein [Treponema sp.]